MTIQPIIATPDQQTAMQDFANLIGTALDYLAKYEATPEIGHAQNKLVEAMQWMHTAVITGAKIAEVVSPIVETVAKIEGA